MLKRTHCRVTCTSPSIFQIHDFVLYGVAQCQPTLHTRIP